MNAGLPHDLPALLKWPLSLLIAFSGLTGYVLAGKEATWRIIWFAAGLFVLAAGAAALNQYQERRQDALMARTKNRPLPSGRISPLTALLTALIFIAGGLTALTLLFPPFTAVLGGAGVLWYNGVYTPLKRKTAFAAIPGALTGALPPVMGWLAAGGALPAPVLWALAFFFFLWQAPHFWLLLGIYGAEYPKAGFPTLTDVFSPRQLARIIFIWMLAVACAGLLFPLFGLLGRPLFQAFLAVGVIGLGAGALPLLKTGAQGMRVYRRAFIHLNLFALWLMIILLIDHGFQK